MLTLVRQMLGSAAQGLIADAADPGAGLGAGEARRRRWVRNLWLVVVPVGIGLWPHLNLIIALGLSGFIFSFMILDEIGRDREARERAAARARTRAQEDPADPEDPDTRD